MQIIQPTINANKMRPGKKIDSNQFFGAEMEAPRHFFCSFGPMYINDLNGPAERIPLSD